MNDLRLHLSQLGLSQYIEKFSEEGFESWETVLDITESDLEALGVKLGHRRVLQREIAQTRGLGVEQVNTSFTPGSHNDRQRQGGDVSRTDGQVAIGSGQKRKYRRHPKSDENAPERPPSAYVIFSNKIREELKPENLSFTAIAKRVGERWQEISPEEKEPYESGAAAAKEKYHSQMTEYKTTKSYRDYQQYLADFEAKHASNPDGKRPKFTLEETQESTTSSGSVISQQEGLESLSGSTDLVRRGVGSVSSVGLYSTTGGLASPGSTTSGPALRPGGPPSLRPLGNTSPLSASSSTPSIRKESSTNQLLYNSIQGRTLAEPQSERTAIFSSGSNQNSHRMSPLESKETRTLQGLFSGPFTEPRMSGIQSSPLNSPQWSVRTPTQFHYSASDSSRSSKASTLSSGSTAASSLLPPDAAFDEEKRIAPSLPPLATLGATSSPKGSSYTEQAARPSLQPFASRIPSSIAQDQPAQPPFSSSSSSGMNFESLQLPLPYNVSFGHRPLPRPDSGSDPANAFDLEDMSREGSLLGGLNLDQEQGGATPTMSQGPPQPRHPPYHPNLPTLPPVLREDSHDPFPHNADPLSVLAYAGRIVGRERGTPRPP